MSKAVATTNQSQNLTTASASTEAFDGIASGFENVTARDILIPRLSVLQGLSPQVSRGKPEYDEKAKVGDIYDIGMQESFPEGIIFIPVYYAKQWLEWAPRASNKGLVRIHNTDAILNECQKDEQSGRMVLPNGNYIADTAQFYGLNVTANFRKTFIPMASTQLKKAKRLLTLATSEKLQRDDGSQYTPPLFYRSYGLTSVPEANNQGNWMGWKIERGLSLPELPNWKELLEDIKSFRQSLAAGTIQGDVTSMEDESKTIDHNAAM
jgi:hypothetical protein